MVDVTRFKQKQLLQGLYGRCNKIQTEAAAHILDNMEDRVCFCFFLSKFSLLLQILEQDY